MADIGMTNVALALAIGVRPETVSRIFAGDKRFTNGHAVTIMRLFPRLTSYCYEYMRESGELQNTRRNVTAAGSIGNSPVTV